MTGFSPAVRALITARSSGKCEICGLHAADEIHHRRPRGMGGSKRPDTNTASAGVHLCRDCHRLVELHRSVAFTCGWLVSQYAEPSAVLFMYRGDLVKLDDDGGKACA